MSKQNESNALVKYGDCVILKNKGGFLSAKGFNMPEVYV